VENKNKRSHDIDSLVLLAKHRPYPLTLRRGTDGANLRKKNAGFSICRT